MIISLAHLNVNCKEKIFDLVHKHGGLVHIHCHGNLDAVTSFALMGKSRTCCQLVSAI